MNNRGIYLVLAYHNDLFLHGNPRVFISSKLAKNVRMKALNQKERYKAINMMESGHYSIEIGRWKNSSYYYFEKES